jgi:hypothetical protein
MASSDSRSAHIRSRLSHPVIDADGHIVESTPVLLDYMREVGGPDMATSKNARRRLIPALRARCGRAKPSRTGKLVKLRHTDRIRTGFPGRRTFKDTLAVHKHSEVDRVGRHCESRAREQQSAQERRCKSHSFSIERTEPSVIVHQRPSIRVLEPLSHSTVQWLIRPRQRRFKKNASKFGESP